LQFSLMGKHLQFAECIVLMIAHVEDFVKEKF